MQGAARDPKCEMCAGVLAKTPLRRGKRDIVDTIFHASRATRHLGALESALPTAWEGQTRSRASGSNYAFSIN